jgi:hypothetical protein
MTTYNPPPVQAPIANNPSELLTQTWLQWFNWLYSLVKSLVTYSGSVVQVPLTGFNITIGSTQNVLTLNPAGTLAAGTVIMPSSPVDGLSVEIASTKTISSFTLSANAGQTLLNAPTSLAAGVGVGFYYNAALTTWFRRY